MMGGYPSMWRSMGQQQPMNSPYSGMGGMMQDGQPGYRK
jgi:hypothetical protein